MASTDLIIDRYFDELERVARGEPKPEPAPAESRSAPAGIASGAVGFGAGGPVWLDIARSKRPPSPYELTNAYKNVAYSCIQLNANGVARVPLRLYAKTSKKQARPRRSCRSVPAGRQRYLRSLPSLARQLESTDSDQIDEITEHPLLAAFDSPNDFFDGNGLLQLIARQLDCVGSAYLFPERPLRADGTGDPTQAREGMKLWGLQSQYVYAVKGQGTEVLRSYRYFGDTYAPSDLVRIRYVSLRDPYLSSYAPLHACFESVGLGDYYLSTVESFLKNDAQMSLLVSPKDGLNRPWDDAARKRWEVEMNTKFGRGRQGRVMTTDGSVDVNPIAYPPADLSGLEISKWERLLVANCFDVPISLLQAEDTNRAVASEGTHQHQYYAIAPRCCIIANALTHQAARPVDDRLFFAFDDPVRRDEERDSKIIDMQLKNGFLSINEARAADGLEPVEWGDEPWFPQTLIQPTAAAEAREHAQGIAEKVADKPVAAPPGKTPDKDEKPADRAMWDRFGRALDQLEREVAA